jgi:MFS family permease
LAVNFVFYYGITFFKNSGVQDAFVISIVTSAVNVGMTIPGIYGIERFGRRRLLLVGCIGMCLCEYIVAIVGETISVKDLAGQQVLIFFVCIFISFFAATWGPIAWVIIAEMFPLELRAKAVSMSCAANWLSNFAIAYSCMQPLRTY